jgi:hypothetical protein
MPVMGGLLPVMFGGLSVAAVVVVVTAARGDVPWIFAAFWVLALLWNAYWFLWRVGYSIEVNGRVVVWRSVLRRQSVPLSELTGNGSLWVSLDRVTVRAGPSLMMMTGRGWTEFLSRLNAVESDSRFRATGMDRLVDRIPVLAMWGIDGFYERTESRPEP